MTTRISLVCIILTWCLIVPALSGAAEPMPPSSICLDNTQCVSTPTTSTSTAIKWHPGYYMQCCRDSASQSQSYRFGLYDSIASNANVKGVFWSPRWGNLEISQGVYDFSSLTAELAKLKGLASPKYMVIRMDTEGDYGNSSATSVSKKKWPTYIQTQGCLYDGGNSNGIITDFKWWRSDCMNRYIALIQAMGAAIDSDPYFEGIILMRETANQVATTSVATTEFSASGYDTQLRRLYVAAKSAFPHTSVLNNVNYLSGFSEAGSIAHYDYMRSIGVGYFNADTCSDCNIWGDRIARGATTGSTDMRGNNPVWMGAEVSEMGYNAVGPNGGYTPTQLDSFDDNTMHASHIAWDYNEFTGTSVQRWSTGLLPYINAKAKPTYTTCPKVYSDCKTR